MTKQKLEKDFRNFVKSIDHARIKANKSSEKIYVKTELFQAIKFTKEFFHYDILKTIIATPIEDEQIELNYVLDNIIDEDSVILAFIIKDKVSSIVGIFDNALEIERKITQEYGLTFA